MAVSYKKLWKLLIDKEIKKHISNKIEENRRAIKKNCKWIYDLLDKKVVEDKLNKNLIDYEKFKNETNSEIIGINNINPEIVMDKYFNMKYPFELSKPYEFKDSFFLESVFEYANSHLEVNGILVVTKDNGITKAIKENGLKRILDKYKLNDKKKAIFFCIAYIILFLFSPRAFANKT